MAKLFILLFVYLSLVGFLDTSNGVEEDYRYMSSLSKYEAIRGDVREVQIDSIQECTSTNLWIFHRHGTRLPSSPEIDQIAALLSVRDDAIENHKNGRGSLSEEELERLQKWTFDPSIEAIQMYLTEEGHNETYRTSLRYKERFPSLLNKSYSKDDFYFRHSDTQRTLQTSYAFIDGIFGENAHENITDIVLPQKEDYLLYPSGACSKYSEVISDPNNSQTNDFLESDAALEALNIISTRLGFENPLSISNLLGIFGACGYDSAWYQETEWIGPWCTVLEPEGRKVGEYYWDLLFFSQSGYGIEVKEKAGCGGPKDLWERFATATGELDLNDKKESVTGLFSHDAFIMLSYTALGLLRDYPPLNATNFDTQDDRKWRTSKIVPFASNIAAVLHECPLDKEVEYKVLLLANDSPWEGIPNCPGGVCSWENFKSWIKPVADSCNFEEFC